ncbi:MAG: BlaI/MecI/CopY family transcriptional regulator [Rhizobiaceae bacterium]|nr:BlaI/MecI/CopY family transcriptional regulator [Rhizobiaceae bacterium]
MRKRKTHELLTEVELEFMTLLWDLGDASVRDVLSKMDEDRDLAYTSAATILRILEQKGFVSSKKDGKSLIYSAILTKNEYQSRLLKDVSAKLFDNTPAALVATLVNDDHLTQDALEELRVLLGRKLGDDSG